eukprot:GHVT01100289.1.p1 GENE.GHVT01100289.1~~GHVT01100289.1.p1  ORF type:complete len:195 (-),score=58.98 GHVT01100289.1:522-1106(-)
MAANSQDPRELFLAAASAIFNNWTALSLAVEHGWGGRRGREKRRDLLEAVVYALDNDRHMNSERLAAMLAEKLLTSFSMELDDESDVEVAALVCEVFEACKKGNVEPALKVLAHKPTGLDACTKPEGSGAAESDESGSSGSGSSEGEEDEDDEEDESMEDDRREDLTKAPSGKLRPQPDADGWTTVGGRATRGG